MQNKICLAGRELVFEAASEMIENMMLVEVNAKQIERVCHYYGEELTVELPYGVKNQNKKSIAEEYRPPTLKDGEYYFMLDGSMLLTREEKWKESKLCRIFRAENNVQINKDRNLITESRYISHLGGAEEFFQKVDYYAMALKKKVFIADGARWIWNYVETFYPESIQILDFYHTKEHLCAYAAERITDQQTRQPWIDEQINLLFEDKVEEVIKNIKTKPLKSSRKEKLMREKLINYYQSHKKRMRYKSFQEAGYLIGSGPIESAHRTVVQKRLKLSGQRWTKKGAQQILNLRTANLSGDWGLVEKCIRMAG